MLEIENLSIAGKGGRPILESIFLKIPNNRITCLLGESGAGKTVLARTISGLMPDTLSIRSGQFKYRGRPVFYDMLKKMRGREIFYSPQNAAASLNPVLKLKHQFRDFVQTGEKRVAEILRRLGFGSPDRILNSYPFELSGGENQRCLLAMAIIREPGFLILDEPFSSLDFGLTAELAKLLKQIQKDYRLSLLIISHHVRITLEFAHYKYFISEGRLNEKIDEIAVHY